MTDVRGQISHANSTVLSSDIRHLSSLYTLGRLSPSRSLHNGFRRGFVVHAVARPGNRYDRAARRSFAIGKVEAGAGALEQRLGDEDAKPEAAGVALAAGAAGTTAGGEVGFSDPRNDAGTETGAVVADDHGDALLIPFRGDLDLAAG